MKREQCIKLINAVATLNEAGIHSTVNFRGRNEVEVIVLGDNFHPILKTEISGEWGEKVVDSLSEELERLARKDTGTQHEE